MISSLYNYLSSNGETQLDEAKPDTEKESELQKPVKEQDVKGAVSTAEGDECPTAFRVLFLSSDTGGGHRASAESLAKQFEILYPGTTYDLLDIMSEDGCPPYNSIVESYKHLSAHPQKWKFVYEVTNSRAMEFIADAHLKVMCERAIRSRIMSYNPNVVVSVHPLMTNVPAVSCAKISEETGQHLPMFTVVTDLGSGHCLWFANAVEKVFIASDQIRKLAKIRGKVPDEKLVQSGLPIRHDFAVQAKNLGDRMSSEGKAYQISVRENLGLRKDPNEKFILLMGGGEGVGSLSSLVDALYVGFTEKGIRATILVVCGRNEILREELQERDWASVIKYRKYAQAMPACFVLPNAMNVPLVSSAGCLQQGMIVKKLQKIMSSTSLAKQLTHDTMEVPLSTENEENKVVSPSPYSDDYMYHDDDNGEHFFENETQHYGNINAPSVDIEYDLTLVEVIGLGFVTRMAEYMIAADVLVTKAGPGTIAEAASVSLPVMLTNFLPGQEEGNVDYVVDGGFGAYRSDADPVEVAEEVSLWLTDDEKLTELSVAACAKGAPNAAAEIVRVIGDSTLRWIDSNKKVGNES
mmetsp:Transcript_60987/g.71344  ORF Transcript_60987/g.71344 Transcript_60987/m.71344 type:complete len:580 (-) Transcript_60987:553-2292(-)